MIEAAVDNKVISWGEKDYQIPLEMELMIILASPIIDEEAEKKLALLTNREFNWDFFCHLGQYHGVIPLLYKKMQQLDLKRMPSFVKKYFQKEYQANALRVMGFTGELIRMTKIMEAQKVRLLAIKGPALAEQIYGDITARLTSDLDLLVAREDFWQAEKLLLQEGYQRIEPDFNVTAKQMRNLMRQIYHFQYYHQQKQICVELHWQISLEEFYQTKFNELWNRKSIINKAEHQFYTLSPEDSFLYLALHGAYNSWPQLRMIMDVGRVLQNNNLNWELLVRKAKINGVLEMVVQAVSLAGLVFELSLPEVFRKYVASQKIDWLVQFGLHKVLQAPQKRETALPWTSIYHWEYYNEFQYKMRLIKRKPQKIKWLLKKFTPIIKNYQEISLGDRYHFCYYFIRFLDIIWRHCLKRAGNE